MGNFISMERPEAAWADNPPLTVPILSLDMFVEQRPDLSSGRIMMKVDVEGYEPEVMAGADVLLSSGRVGAIVFEKSDAYIEPVQRQAFDQIDRTAERAWVPDTMVSAFTHAMRLRSVGRR
jgi:hypothetical protein